VRADLHFSLYTFCHYMNRTGRSRAPRGRRPRAAALPRGAASPSRRCFVLSPRNVVMVQPQSMQPMLMLWVLTAALLPLAQSATVQLSNPMPLFNATSQPLLVHDGDVVQWEKGGPFYYYGMHYDRCHYISCGDKTCGHLKDHKVLIWKTLTMTNRSWTLVGTALGPSPTLGTFYRPHVNYNPTTKLFVLIVNGDGEGKYKNFASTSESPVGPFTKPIHMSLLTFAASKAYNMGDFGFFAEGDDAYLAYNVMGVRRRMHPHTAGCSHWVHRSLLRQDCVEMRAAC
jgi:hypothetical protein